MCICTRARTPVVAKMIYTVLSATSAFHNNVIRRGKDRASGAREYLPPDDGRNLALVIINNSGSVGGGENERERGRVSARKIAMFHTAYGLERIFMAS